MNHSDPPTSRRAGLMLFALSFAALFLELMLIRWVPAVVRFVAYYANLLLISSFLGLGLGAMLARRRWRLFDLFPIALAAHALLLLLCGREVLPSTSSEARFYVAQSVWVSYVSLIAIFISNTIVFVPIGQRVGALFHELPPLRAYAWDLSGSLCGTLCFGAFSLLYFSPLLGVCGVMVIYLVLAGRRGRVAATLCFPVAFGAVLYSTDAHAIWSPYHYITVSVRAPGLPTVYDPPPHVRTMHDPPVFFVRVGRDFYQQHATLEISRYSQGFDRIWMERSVDRYMLPYQIAMRHDRVAVMGAGGGVDVQAALMAGASHVDAVEIDPTLVQISRRFNPSGVYDHPAAQVHPGDARAFLRSTAGGYDVIAFGYLDSQSLFSSMSNVRIDGFIYTVNSMRTAWSKLNDDGLLVVSFCAPVDWLRYKLDLMIREATGVEPMIYQQAENVVIMAPKGNHHAAPPSFGSMEKIELPKVQIDLPTDDWPYLYLRKRSIPPDYLTVIGTLLAISVATVAVVQRGRRSVSDTHFFLLGLGFLLLQTKSITDCSLYFGTTWLVTTIVVAGVLIMVLASNLVAMLLRSASVHYYWPLLLSLLVLLIVPRDAILARSLAERLLWSLMVVPLPIFFAGLIFSTTFRESGNPSASFGANLIGATVGGFCEYLGMAVGSQALSWLVIAAYLASLMCRMLWKSRSPAQAPSPALTLS